MNVTNPLTFVLILFALIFFVFGVSALFAIHERKNRDKLYAPYWIEKISAIDWSIISPEKIISISLLTAKEFAASVRTCQSKYGQTKGFSEFTEGEIQTNNLVYEDYYRVGDHWEFLHHFANDKILFYEYSKKMSFGEAESILRKYSLISNTSPDLLILTLLSREIELQDIFIKILKAHDWAELGYGFYKYYLERHIELDSGDEGHAKILNEIKDLSNLSVSEKEFLGSFWKSRYNVYETIM